MKKSYASVLMLAAAMTLSAQQTVPEGVELSKFITENVPMGSAETKAFQLLPGATYQLSDTADFQLTNVALTGDATNRPTVVISGNGLFMTQNGLQISGINFDMTDAPVSTLVAMSENPDSAFTTERLGLKALSGNVKDGYVCMNPVSFTGCDFRNLPGSLFRSGTKDWALQTMTISNCVMQFNKQNGKAVISFEDAWSGVNGVKDLTIEKSTFYNTGSTKKARFIRYGNKNNARPFAIWGPDAKSNHTLDGCTFYATFSDDKFANNVPEVKDFTVTINNTILYDISRPDEWFSRSGKISCESDGNNMAWLAGNDGGNPQTIRKEVEEIAIIENPDFVGPVDKAWNLAEPFGGVNFRPLNATAVEKKIGDPRWFNAPSENGLTIPAGSEISEFVAGNVPDGTMDDLTIKLVPGAAYTLTGKADTKLANVTFIGDADNRPTVTITEDGSFSPSNGMRISGINFDMTDAPATSFIRLQTNPDSCFTTKALGMMNDSSSVVEGYIMFNPITVENCNFRNIPNSFLCNDSVGWAVKEFNINNCVLQFNKQKSDPVINFSTWRGEDWGHFGQVLDMNFTNSTFYNTSGDIKVYFVRYINKKTAMPYLAFGAGTQSHHTFDGCTFFKTFSVGQFGNNLPESKNFIVTFNNSILYGISRPDKYKAELLGENNVVWDGGVDDDGNPQNLRASITAISLVADPEFAGPTDLPFDLSEKFGGVSFNPLNAECHATGAGDPRWFDAPTAIENIGEDAEITDGPVEYFNLQGVRVGNANLMPGIYIKRQGGKASKVYVK